MITLHLTDHQAQLLKDAIRIEALSSSNMEDVDILDDLLEEINDKLRGDHGLPSNR